MDQLNVNYVDTNKYNIIHNVHMIYDDMNYVNMNHFTMDHANKPMM